MDKIIRMNFTKKLECAVMVTDDFSDKVLTASEINVLAENVLNEKPTKKPDGFFLFFKGHSPIEAIRLSGTCYSEEIIKVDTESLDPKNPVIRLRARPGRAYPFPKGTTGLRGKIEQGSAIDLICLNGLNNIAMLNDYNAKDETIQLFAAKNENIEGKRLAIVVKGKAEPEIFTVKEEDKDAKGTFMIEAPLSKAYKKSECKIYRVFTGKGDVNGEYLLPIKNDFTDECKLSASKDGGKWIEISTEFGKFTQRDFL